VFWN